MSDHAWQPATFQERGVAVPFTTPILAGARARAAPRGVELIVPHPAGARGVYVMACAEVGNFCAATMHDLLLADRVAACARITPATIAAAARAVVATGAAGQAAQAAATQATANDRSAEMAASFGLLQALVAHTHPTPYKLQDLDRLGKSAILALSPWLGRPATRVTTDIEDLAQLYAAIGVAPAPPASLARLATQVAALAPQLRAVASGIGGRSEIAAALVASSAAATAALAQLVLQQLWSRAADPATLLADWGTDPAALSALLRRPAWVLDGWHQICLVWQAAGAGQPRSALGEMALMVPVLPAEYGQWGGPATDESDRARLRRVIHGFEDWRTGGLVIDLVARNEQLLAIAA